MRRHRLFLFLFSPIWGRLSDRHGSHGVLMFGLIGFGLTSMIFVFVEGLTAVYAERALSGLFAASVIPVAAAALGKLTITEQGRARRLTFVSMAGIAGFLLGRMEGMFITRLSENMLTSILPGLILRLRNLDHARVSQGTVTSPTFREANDRTRV